MNKKGFTLIELLAIIVILGILASISTMMVGNYIKKSKQESTRVVALNMLNAAYDDLELVCMNYNFDSSCDIDSFEYDFLGTASDLLEDKLTTSAWGNDIVEAVVNNLGYYEGDKFIGNKYVCIRDSKGYGISTTETLLRENSDDIVYEKISKCPRMLK